jgi:hypothetical protein
MPKSAVAETSPWWRLGSLNHHQQRYFRTLFVLAVILGFLRYYSAVLTIVAIGHGVIPAVAMSYTMWRENRSYRLARQKKSRELMRAAQERFGLSKA